MNYSKLLYCLMVLGAANVCHAQFNGATALDTRSGYFDAITAPPTQTTSNGWSSSGTFNPPAVLVLNSGGTKTATQVSQNGRITAKTHGMIFAWANCFARVGAEAIAAGNALVTDVAKSDADAQSSGSYNAPAAFNTLLMYNFVHPNLGAPAFINYGALFGNANGNYQQMRYLAGQWQIYWPGLGWTNTAAGSTAVTAPGAIAAGSSPFAAGATINTQTAGAGGGFGALYWSADVANF